MDAYDVLIVGGGPAGSSCARRLTRAGMKVLLLDKCAFPRAKPCAGWITPQVVAALELDVEEYRHGRIWQPIYGFCSGLIGGDQVEVTYSHAVSYGIRRCEFDTYLLERSGAECRLHEPVRELERRGDQWVVNGRFCAPMLVGAGGHFCPVARRLGARRDAGASVVVAQEVEFEAEAETLRRGSVRPETPQLFFCRDLRGYGWCFRKQNYLNIGLGRLDSDRLSQHVEEFCDFLRLRRKVCCTLPQRFCGHAYQLYERIRPTLIGQGVVLVGDAAGLAYPQSGEGIRPAVESGWMAADTILAAAGRFRREDLATYEQQIRRRFGKPRGAGPIDWLPAAWLSALAGRMLITKWFARHIVMDRWFLHNQLPPLTNWKHG
jgi:geranylgeranyl reductase family protein